MIPLFWWANLDLPRSEVVFFGFSQAAKIASQSFLMFFWGFSLTSEFRDGEGGGAPPSNLLLRIPSGATAKIIQEAWDFFQLQFTLDIARKLVLNGADVHPGANFVESKSKGQTFRKFLEYGNQVKIAKDI